MTKFTAICSFFFLCSFLLTIITASAWTEHDEAKRIAQIKSDEKRLYEEQMGEKLPPLSGGGSSGEGIITAGVQQQQRRHRWPPPPFSAAADQQHLRMFNFTSHRPPLVAPPPPSAADEEALWCFHCASPWNAISEPMQRVVKNLLDIRRAQYPPPEMVSRDCVEPRVLDFLPRQICRGYSHCQTLMLIDHDSGSAFTMRGCAERFGAVDAAVLERRGHNMCKRLHEKVDIQECICEHRKYCYAGPERSSTLGFSPMSEWQPRNGASLSGQAKVPFADALQRNGAGGGRRGTPTTTLIMIIMVIMVTRVISSNQQRWH